MPLVHRGCDPPAPFAEGHDAFYLVRGEVADAEVADAEVLKLAGTVGVVHRTALLLERGVPIRPVGVPDVELGGRGRPADAATCRFLP